MKKHMRSTFLNPKYNPSDRDSVSNSALGGVSAPQVPNAKSNSSAHPFRAHNSHTEGLAIGKVKVKAVETV